MTLIKVNNRGQKDNLGRRNLIINGAMQIAQRATAATNTGGVSVYRTVDRLKLWNDNDGAHTTEQSTVAPDGFSNSVKFQVTSADTSLAAAQYAVFAQNIEAQNLQHLAYGTNSAKTITVSFYVRSNKTGTYAIALEKQDNTTYRYIKEFSISSADTWEKKTVTFAGETGSSITDDNNTRLYVQWVLLAGSNYTSGTHPGNVWHSTNANRHPGQVNVMDNTSNNFYLTGVQLETGSTATDFEFLRHSDNLNACYRYFQTVSAYAEYSMGTTGSFSGHRTAFLGGGMRAAPTFTTQSNSGSSNSSLNGFGSKAAARAFARKHKKKK